MRTLDGAEAPGVARDSEEAEADDDQHCGEGAWILPVLPPSCGQDRGEATSGGRVGPFWWGVGGGKCLDRAAIVGRR